MVPCAQTELSKASYVEKSPSSSALETGLGITTVPAKAWVLQQANLQIYLPVNFVRIYWAYLEFATQFSAVM